MFQVAIYGKGGIGKSTISANVSHSLAGMGKKVVQIGCDPKHDSTRLLLGGKTQDTVLDYLRKTPKERRSLDDVVLPGSGGVSCIEAGGPEPGVGCAGRGILTMFDFLDGEGLNDGGYDYKLYDVLGDVVCGGFAVPLRKGNADAVYIVTSGEFMSLYAANNILKGLQNYDDGTPRVGGLILNMRGMENELEYVRNFAEGVGLPIVSCIPRDPLFADAESRGMTLSEAHPGSEADVALKKIAEDVVSKSMDPSSLYRPRPLGDDAMDDVAKGNPIKNIDKAGYKRMLNPVSDGRSLKSCAGGGAIGYSAMVDGTHTVVHGPTSCAYVMSCYFSDTLTPYRDLRGNARSFWKRVSCTNLDGSSSVFGGLESLRSVVRERAGKGDDVVFVVSMCVPGMIGDDVVGCCAELSEELGIRVVPVPANGVSAGTVIHGRDLCINAVLDLVEPAETKDPGLINIIGDYRSHRRFESALDESVEKLIRDAGFRVNTIYPGKCDVSDIRAMGRAAFAVKAQDDFTFTRTADMICERFGIRLMREPLPTGMAAAERWLDEVSSLTGRNLEGVKSRMRLEYENGIRGIRKRTEGRSVLIVERPTDKNDWLYELLEDLGVRVLKTREATYNRWFMGSEASEGKEIHSSGHVASDVEELSPDLVLSDLYSDLQIKTRCWPIGRPQPGLAGILEYAERLWRVLHAPAVEGWRSA